MARAPVVSWRTTRWRFVSVSVTMPVKRKSQPARRSAPESVLNCATLVTKFLALSALLSTSAPETCQAPLLSMIATESNRTNGRMYDLIGAEAFSLLLQPMTHEANKKLLGPAKVEAN